MVPRDNSARVTALLRRVLNVKSLTQGTSISISKGVHSLFGKSWERLGVHGCEDESDA